MDLFNYDKKEYKITKPIRLIELFAGYGSQSLALKYLGIEHENYKVVEFDKQAICSYNEIHGTNFPTLDITEIKGQNLEIEETDKYEYIMTYSFSCQDLSLAGKGAGMGKGTRSGLLWEVERLLNEVDELPQILLMENVPQVIGSKNIKDFSEWVKFLEDKGYSCYWQNLIATDYGIPQSRKRTFMISILGDFEYSFPKPIPLNVRLQDMLELDVENKYYLTDSMSKYLRGVNQIKSKYNRREVFERVLQQANSKGISPTLTTRIGSRPTDTFILETYQFSKSDNFMKGQDRFKEYKYISDTLQTTQKEAVVLIEEGEVSVRKLTPKEAFRLMGVKDEDYDKLTCSNTQLYKQAGNSIVVNVLMAIFKQLL